MSDEKYIPQLSDETSGSQLRALRLKGWRLFLFVSALAIFGLFAWPLMTEQIWSPIEGRAAGPGSFANTATPFQFQVTASETSPPLPTATSTPGPEKEIAAANGDYIFLSISESGFQHINAFNIHTLALTRLTNGDWNDEGLAIHPSGLSIAFTSDRNEHWDLLQMNLVDGSIVPISNDLAYDGQPSWAKDGDWLAFERYENDNLDIFIRPADGSLEAVRLTNSKGVDHSPNWSPAENVMAFVSDRGGQNRIWLLNMDNEGDARFEPLLPSSSDIQVDPAWSPNGEYLAWSAFRDGYWRVFFKNMSEADSPAIELGLGQQASWSPDGLHISAVIEGADENFLVAYDLGGQLIFPATPIQGKISGIAWGAGLANSLNASFQGAAAEIRVNWETSAALQNNIAQELTTISDVDAPFPELASSAVASFDALRKQSGNALGWDVFAKLEELYRPLSVPPDPGQSRDWQYTGRALQLLENFVFTDWMRVVPEEINGQLYWRVYMRAVEQNGRMGKPLYMPGWDFAARIDGSNEAYQAGGRAYAEVTSGYWVDISAIAEDFGWERLSALSNWRSFFPGARFDQWVFSQGLSWEEAMLQISSPEKLSGFLNP